jgi:hypothetical protein
MFKWKRIGDIEINDLITWWGYDIPLLDKKIVNGKWIITVIDPVEKIQKDFKYNLTDELMILIED